MPDLSSLNEKQRLIVEEVADAVSRPTTSGNLASTVIAATLLLKGRTAHSTFCTPSSDLGIALRSFDAIIWDETSLRSRYAVEYVEKLLRDMASPVNS
ncbi:hypothetical protein ANCCAN_00207 [Ancylostoma caninum]|uniref:DNA helicase n=1 Tax=Ancylostoma caninum TaxID=29170 RepID=A0A368HAS9_ANCCA|nr:hypothetical protein ANCCAN_00207 [Ancylostoma caninum]